MNKKNTFILLLIIIISGSFFRLYNLSKQSYWMDEGYTINAVISAQENGITKTGASILDSGESYSCPLYCLPTAKISNFLGNNAFSFRILSVIFGILSIILVFFITKLLFKSKKTALLSTFFISFSYIHIAWSRQARWYTMLLFFFWLSIYFFYKATYWGKSKTLNYVLAIFFLILAILTHKIALILPFVFIFWIFVNNFHKKDLYKILILIITPFILFPSFFINSIKNMDLSYNLPYYLNFYLRNYFIFIILAIFYYFSTTKKNKKKVIFLTVLLLFYLIPLSFFTNIVHYRYMFHLTPIFFVLGSVGAINIYKKLRHNYLKIAFIFLIILAFFVFKQGVFYPHNFYFLEADMPAEASAKEDNPSFFDRPYYAYTPQPDFNKAYGVIGDLIGNDEIVISSHPHFNKIFLDKPGFWLSYNYLGFEKEVEKITNNKEYYVGAEVINDLEELKIIIKNNHGYIVFDYMAQDNRISKETIDYIQQNLNLIFHDKINIYSQIWIYKF